MSRTLELYFPKFHIKQQYAFDSLGTDVLFGGATRGGKSFFVRKALILWCLAIPGLQCDIFRLNFDDVIANHMQGDNSFPILLSVAAKEGLVTLNKTEIRFYNNSLISLEHASNVAKVMQKHQGIAKQVRVFEESTQISSELIKWLTGWVSMPEEMRKRIPPEWEGRFPKIIHSTNPVGLSAPYYRREYIQGKEPYEIYQFGPWKRQYIPALVEDNPSENAERTRKRIESMGDLALADALLNANWNALVGDFFPEWNPGRHVIDDFTPPDHWFRFRTMDLGYAEPTAVYWFAVSDGEPFKDQEGRERWYPRGAFIIYKEWYVCDANDPTKGLRLSNEDIAKGIIERSEFNHINLVTLTDSLAFQYRGGEGIDRIFAKYGVPLTLGDTSRVQGWAQMRSRLIGKEVFLNEKLPFLYLCRNCKYAIDYIPALPRHPSESKKEDAAEHGEATHSNDAIRIGCMAFTVIKDRIAPTQERIERAVNSLRPTMRKILNQRGVVINGISK